MQSLAVAVLAHRLLPTAQAQLNRRTAEQVVLEILQHTPVPAAAQPAPGGFFNQQPPGARRL